MLVSQKIFQIIAICGITAALVACGSDEEQQESSLESLPSSVAQSVSSATSFSSQALSSQTSFSSEDNDSGSSSSNVVVEQSSSLSLSSAESSYQQVSSTQALSSVTQQSSSITQQSSTAQSSSTAQQSSESSQASSTPVQAKTAIQLIDEQCTSCHVNFHSAWSAYDTDQAWLDSGYIDTANPENSRLLVRMRFHSVGSRRDMPQQPNNNAPADDPYSREHYETIRAWVSDIADTGESSSFAAEPNPTFSQSSVQSISSAQSVSSASVSVPPLNKTAVEVIDEFCTSCHFGSHDRWEGLDTDEKWLAAQSAATSTAGENYIDRLDPQDSLILRRLKLYGGANSDMPYPNNNQTEAFTQQHYDVLEQWVNSFSIKPVEPSNDGTVEIQKAQFDETGFTLELACKNPSDSFNIRLVNPEVIKSNDIGDFTGVKARSNGVTAVSIDSLASQGLAGEFTLTGEGIDIWQDKVYFNGITRAIEQGQLDVTLDVHSVAGVTEDFAKVGLLVSDTDDLSGQMVFVHWAGRRGIAEDSGENGKLSVYRQLHKNPNRATDESSPTPTPVRLRVAYEGDSLKVGGCYDCENPVVGLPRRFNFEPKRVYVIASSHTDAAITTVLSLSDAYGTEGEYETVHTAPVTCENGRASVVITDASTGGLERLNIEISRGEDVAATSSVVKRFSEAASCEIQNDLLEPKLRRLSETQIQNVVIDTFGNLFSDDIWPQMEDGARLIGMNNIADKLNINNLNYERMFAASRAIVDTLLADHEDISACAQSSDASCVSALTQQFGRLLWRRALLSEELDGLMAASADLGENEDQLNLTLNALLLSPSFLFRSELGSLNSSATELSDYEIVSILAFSLWNSSPDDALLRLAEKSGNLSTSELITQIDRMLADDRANAAMKEIYKDYLKLDLVLTRPKDDSFNFDETVRQTVLESAEQGLLRSIQSNMSYLDVFLGNEFYVNSDIDYLFNLDVANNELDLTPISSNQREGILTHPAFLSVHSTLAKSGIVKRGVFSLEQLLCQELPEAPGTVTPVPLPEGIDPAKTSERDLLKITHSSQAACSGCHKVIDPAGFGFENFDSIGRYRETEKQGVPIDASGVMDNVGEHVLSYSNSADYARALVGSPQMQHCVSQRFLESFLGQELAHNSCELKKFQKMLDSSDGTFKDMLRALVQLESFAKRH